jgi:hypothetical protein
MLDRIDWVMASSEAAVLDSAIVGPEGSPEVDIPIQPYPSDHRAVVSTVRVTPTEPPVFVAVDQRRAERGDTLVVWYHAPGGEETDLIAIVPADGSADAPLMWLPPYEASYFGSVTFGLGGLEAGEYAALLIGADGEELSRSPFWVVEPGAQPTLTTDRDIYAAGEPITVSWDNAPALKWDWIGLYAADEPDLYNGYWAYAYTDASVRGAVVFDAGLLGEAMLPAGDYVARLLMDDGFAVLATASFTVGE